MARGPLWFKVSFKKLTVHLYVLIPDSPRALGMLVNSAGPRLPAVRVKFTGQRGQPTAPGVLSNASPGVSVQGFPRCFGLGVNFPPHGVGGPCTSSESLSSTEGRLRLPPGRGFCLQTALGLSPVHSVPPAPPQVLDLRPQLWGPFPNPLHTPIHCFCFSGES